MKEDKDFKVCTIKVLSPSELIPAAKTAVEQNPTNRPATEVLQKVAGDVLKPIHIALLTAKYWGTKGVNLGVLFLDNPDAATKKLIIQHMNAWSEYANVQFQESSQGEVRILRAHDGYWSYLGTDILHIPRNQPTMNLDGFTSRTPLSEYKRVVRHETGHTLGFPHEHMRKEIVDRIDPQRAISYFAQMDGWDAQTVQEQVLTSLDDATLMETPPDVTSIMCYDLPGSIMADGIAVPGGMDIDPSDGAFAAKIYPKETIPPPPGGGAKKTFSFSYDPATGKAGSVTIK